jgi:hypothetical protein
VGAEDEVHSADERGGGEGQEDRGPAGAAACAAQAASPGRAPRESPIPAGTVWGRHAEDLVFGNVDDVHARRRHRDSHLLACRGHRETRDRM